MGSCWSARIKAVSPSHGVSSVSVNSKKASVTTRTKSDRLSTPSFSGSIGCSDVILDSSNLKKFTLSDLKSATRNFRPDSVLGQGGFGSVFKGWVDEESLTASRPGTGMVIAVKRLNQEGPQGHKEWLTEVTYLGQLHHPNLVKLIGYCLEDEQRLLVYEFMQKGSLENHLFRRSSHFEPLSWNLRMKVALDAAKGLAYLHSPEAKVIYRDFKTSNVLLDSKYNAKLSDFGLAKDGPIGSESYVSTRVMGTHGYAAPEYLATGHLNIKSDVYSFGVVLLELLSGKRSIDMNRPPGEHYLVEWAKPLLSNKQTVLQIFDPRIQGQYSVTGAYKAVSLTLQCLSLEPKHRPKMGEVVNALEQLQDDRGTSRVAHAKQRERPQNVGVPGQKPKRANLAEVMRNDRRGYPKHSSAPLV